MASWPRGRRTIAELHGLVKALGSQQLESTTEQGQRGWRQGSYIVAICHTSVVYSGSFHRLGGSQTNQVDTIKIKCHINPQENL